MPVFEKRGTRPGFVQVNTNLWIFLVAALCIAIGAAVFFGTRDPMHSHIENRTKQILTYKTPSCRGQVVVDAITFTREGNRIVDVQICGKPDEFYFKNDGLEFTEKSQNFGKPFLSDKGGGQ